MPPWGGPRLRRYSMPMPPRGEHARQQVELQPRLWRVINGNTGLQSETSPRLFLLQKHMHKHIRYGYRYIFIYNLILYRYTAQYLYSYCDTHTIGHTGHRHMDMALDMAYGIWIWYRPRHITNPIRCSILIVILHTAVSYWYSYSRAISITLTITTERTYILYKI